MDTHGHMPFSGGSQDLGLGQVESKTATISHPQNPFSIGSLVVPSVNLSNNEGPELIGFWARKMTGDTMNTCENH